MTLQVPLFRDLTCSTSVWQTLTRDSSRITKAPLFFIAPPFLTELSTCSDGRTRLLYRGWFSPLLISFSESFSEVWSICCQTALSPSQQTPLDSICPEINKHVTQFQPKENDVPVSSKHPLVWGGFRPAHQSFPSGFRETQRSTAEVWIDFIS